jgi:hypothetical protein
MQKRKVQEGFSDADSPKRRRLADEKAFDRLINTKVRLKQSKALVLEVARRCHKNLTNAQLVALLRSDRVTFKYLCKHTSSFLPKRTRLRQYVESYRPWLLRALEKFLETGSAWWKTKISKAIEFKCGSTYAKQLKAVQAERRDFQVQKAELFSWLKKIYFKNLPVPVAGMAESKIVGAPMTFITWADVSTFNGHGLILRSHSPAVKFPNKRFAPKMFTPDLLGFKLDWDYCVAMGDLKQLWRRCLVLEDSLHAFPTSLLRLVLLYI